MGQMSNLSLIDSNASRRAAISHSLAEVDIHIEPYENVEEAMKRWPHSKPLLVHDDGSSLAVVLDRMGSSGKWLPVIGYAQDPTTRMVVQAVLAGAMDYIAWPCPNGAFVAILAELETRAEALGRIKMRETVARSRVERLTKREREVLSAMAGGMSNRMIGDKLSISPRTVEVHRAHALSKMGTNGTSEAIRVAVEAALLD